jgi:tetratricopeptide (TPR) repeat protein
MSNKTNQVFKDVFACVFALGFLMFNFNLVSQNAKIDSLSTLLKKDKADTNKVIHLSMLVRECELTEDYEKGLSYGKESLELAIKLGFKKGIAVASNNIGNIYRLKADYPKALDCFLKSLNIDEELKNKKGIAIALGNIGLIEWSQGDNTKALDYYFRALTIAEEFGYKPLQANNLDNIGSIYDEQGDFVNALDYYQKALKIDKELENKNGIAAHLGNIGALYQNKNDYPSALKYYFEALQVEEELGDKIGIAIWLANIGDIYTTTGRYAEAEKYIKKAIEIEERIGSYSYLMASEEALSQLYNGTGKYQQALIHYKRSTAFKDTVFNQENKKQLVQKEMKYEFSKKEAITKAENDKQQAIAKERDHKQKIIIVSVAGGGLLIILFAGFIFRSLRITRKQRDVIEVQKNEVQKQKEIVEKQKHLVEEHQKEIIDSITYAKRIQTALLTSEEYIKNNLPGEHFILFKPKDIVSGDFYWAFRGSSDTGEKGKGLFYMATADCTGHGVPGAFMSMLNISYFNENVIERNVRAPHEILNEQRNEILKALNPPGSKVVSKDGMDCVMCAYDFDKMELQFAAANNPLWLVRNNELIEFKADKMPVGKHSEDTFDSFTLQRISIQKGDIVYTSTDGYGDQFGSNGKKLMKKKLKEELLKIHTQPMFEQKAYLDQFFMSWKGDTEQIDDVCVIGVKI